ncbi:LPXTG cell wall anchor domain-containing protein, partial [Leuconostoc falkenbergense]|uniref:LPXTG cell wall anchor domain-containing protein n=1 Tax=Leuconostoc falkenbergense TaxID=2766470 RepID=UPI00166B64F3
AAKKAGMTITQNATVTKVITASQYAAEATKIKALYASQKSAIDAALKKQQAANDAYDKEEAQYKVDKAKYDKEKAQYDKDKAQYDKDEAAFENGTDVNTEMQALTQNHVNHDQYDTFMTADVNQKTGEFTLTHDMNDGVSIIGHGVLKGKFNWKVTSKGDGSEVIIADSITLTSYKYANEHPNTAANKNINFHVYDNSGKELFVGNHAGESTFTKEINKTVSLGTSFTLKPNESTDKQQILKVDDNWVYNTHGQIYTKFTNTNKQPTAPTPPKAPTEPAKPTPLKGTYGLTQFIVTPEPKKDVDAGQNAGDKDGSDNGKSVIKGDELTYSLKTTDWPADRTDDMKTIKYVDTLPKEVDYKSTKVYSKDGKTDLTKYFKISYDKKTRLFTAEANADYLKLINADKTKAFELPIVDVYAIANTSNAKFDNTYDIWENDSKTGSNTVENTTPEIKPKKDVESGDVKGDSDKSIDGDEIKKGQEITYALTVNDLPANHASDLKTFKYVDTLPKEVDYKSAKVYSKDGKTDLTKYFKISYDEETRVLTAEANADFFKLANADKTKAFALPVVDVYVTANKDNATIKNTYDIWENGSKTESNTVENKTPGVTPTPTPNTSYVEAPKGGLYGAIATIALAGAAFGFRKPIKKWFHK